MESKHKYYRQVQLGMGLLNIQKCYASSDKTIEIIGISFNYEFTKQMLAEVNRIQCVNNIYLQHCKY